MPVPTVSHWVVLAHPAWGHVRHLNGFIARVLRRTQDRNFVITYLLHQTHAGKAANELVTILEEEGERPDALAQMMSRVRFVGLDGTPELLQSEHYQAMSSHATSSIRYGMEVDSSFDLIWENVLSPRELDQTRELQCATTGKVFDYQGFPRPSVIHVDIYGGPNLKFVKEHDASIGVFTHKIYHWSTEFVSFWRMFRKDAYGQGAIEEEVGQIVDCPERNPAGKSMLDLCFERYNECNNQLLEIPGLKHGMYDYEINPGQVGWPKAYIPGLGKVKRVLSDADGIVVASCATQQPKAETLVRAWLKSEFNTELYATGPGIEDNLISNTFEPTTNMITERESAIIDFLDGALERFGEKSVILVSWGTIWAPFKQPAILEAWLEELVKSGRPFILNRSAELLCRLSPWLDEKLLASQERGIGFNTNWIPQRSVLRHRATGVFLSHCGYASYSESTVPIIAWPSFFDQGIIAQIGVDNDTAWQLYQVRGPEAVHQRCRALEVRSEGPRKILGTMEAVREEARQVLEESRKESKVYQRKSQNLLKQRENLEYSFRKGGRAYEEVSRLLALA